MSACATCARCGKAFPWFATPEEALESIACCDACHERVTFEVDEEAREQVTTLRAQLAEARAERSNIVAYLRHCARVDIGSILSPPSREVVEWCASWIENELDLKWQAKALSATGDEGE